MAAGEVAKVDSPVTLIQGIGPAAASELQKINLFFAFDLLRASAEQIHGSVKSMASIDEVRAWRSMSILLQIEGMTNQWAEALVHSGIKTIEEFIQRPVPELQTRLLDAQSAGLIAEQPTEQQIFGWLLDATHINYTGATNGTVRDPDGNPIAGVEAVIGVRHAMSDVRGRFRLLRIQLGSPQRLILRKAGFETRIIDDPSLTLDNEIIQVSIFEIQALATSSPASPVRLSEFNGDQLPSLSQFSMTTEAHSKDELREGDLLILHKFYDNAADAQLTSKYLEYEDGKFIVLNFKVPISDLPDNPKLKQKFIYRNNTFTAIKLHATRMRYFRGLRKARKAFVGRPRPTTLIEFDHAMAQYFELLKQNTTI